MSTSVVRALQILELLSRTEKPLSLTRIAEQLEIPKSTAHSILRSLVDQRFAAVDEQGTFSIGLKAFEVGSAFVREAGVVSVIAPQLMKLTQAMGVTSHYAVLDGTDAVYLCKEDPPKLGVQLASSIGARLPAHVTAVGKACLAWLPDDAVADHVLQSDTAARTHSRRLEELAKELQTVRELGYSKDDGETAAGIRCVAAPVFGMSGPCGAIGVSYLLGTAASPANIADQVVEAAREATSLLGGRAAR